jgi:hypothetical protein
MTLRSSEKARRPTTRRRPNEKAGQNWVNRANLREEVSGDLGR